MTSQKILYDVIASHSLSDLKDGVSNYLNNGWVCVGGICVLGGKWYKTENTVGRDMMYYQSVKRKI